MIKFAPYILSVMITIFCMKRLILRIIQYVLFI